MLSKKLTFSLTSFIVLLAFGLVCFTPSAVAHDGDAAKTATKNEFGVTLTAAESMVDVSYRGDGDADNIQIASGRHRDGRGFTPGDAVIITLLAKFDVVVNLADPETGPSVDLADRGTIENDEDFDIEDVVVDAYDKEGRALGVLLLDAAESNQTILLSHRDPNNPGKEFLIQIDETQLKDAYSELRGGGTTLEIATLLLSIPAASVQDATLGEIIKHRKGDHFPHSNTVSNVFQIHFVDNDEGDAKYKKAPALTTDVGEVGVPGVVSIDRILNRSAFTPIETGPFNVRVILTEEPRVGGTSGLTTDLVEVTNGTATVVTAGLTYKGTSKPADDDIPSELTRTMVGDFFNSSGSLISVDGDLPEATGRDNKYYTYSVQITPDAGVNGDVTISIKQFMDHVKPVSNIYVPLTPALRVATTLDGNPKKARDARVKNETITVKVMTDAAVDIYKTSADHLAANPTLKALPAKAVIPANGYLVLAAGKTDSDPISGVSSSPAKLTDKKTAASIFYNVTYDYKLPFPADDLSNFFRNGGTLHLLYSDIPAATGSGHDDAKGPTGDKATGYTVASTGAVTSGAVIINEIMWGLDAGSVNGQYIELHNTTGTDIGIDKNEWVIAVGTTGTDSHYTTVVDTASNTVPGDSFSDYFAPPGASGVTVASAANPTVSDLISMARVAGTAAAGSAESSWVASARPSVNLLGRRIGTPGADNGVVALEPAPTTEPEPEPVPTAPIATGADIRITEVMVASNGGRLPQWIELANVSGAEVGLSGWSIDIDNDAADAEVVAESVNVELGDVVLDEDQVVLVVTKTGRNSGVGTGPDAKGDLREERIVNVQSQVSPTDARYSLLSEMAFKIALLPPQKGGVVERGDVVGNLGMGWELPPMSEGDRSSLIRRELGIAKTEILGTDAAGWVLASDTNLDGAYVTTFYGDDEDMGTPGYDASKAPALPVELSMFTAARDRLTGEVKITWETQSELNNAGFYLKRSQQKTGQFVAVNATMIAGAGTTSEKQAYTYTDTTAKPNIVYYYQIEDVSLDGNRQTLTRAHRLKGHIGAAGKLTTLWGELKNDQ